MYFYFIYFQIEYCNSQIYPLHLCSGKKSSSTRLKNYKQKEIFLDALADQ